MKNSDFLAIMRKLNLQYREIFGSIPSPADYIIPSQEDYIAALKNAIDSQQLIEAYLEKDPRNAK